MKCRPFDSLRLNCWNSSSGKDPHEVEAVRSDLEVRRKVKEELGDVLIYALNMCHAFGFDASEVILQKLEINEKKFPVDKAKVSAESTRNTGLCYYTKPSAARYPKNEGLHRRNRQ